MSQVAALRAPPPVRPVWRSGPAAAVTPEELADVADTVVMWTRTGFTNAREVVDAFYDAYPHAPEDK